MWKQSQIRKVLFFNAANLSRDVNSSVHKKKDKREDIIKRIVEEISR